MSPEVTNVWRRSDCAPGIRRLPNLLYALILLSWLGLVVYVWMTQGSWGYGWQIVGTMNFTVAALLALLVVWAGNRAAVWVSSRVARRFAKPL
jgi:hypothetical protein